MLCMGLEVASGNRGQQRVDGFPVGEIDVERELRYEGLLVLEVVLEQNATSTAWILA